MKQLIFNYFSGDITMNEKRTLFRAMETDEELRKEFCAFQQTVALSGCLESESDVAVGRWGYGKLTGRLLRRRMKRVAWHCCKYAALIGVVMVCTGLLMRQFMIQQADGRYTEVTAPGGQRVRVTLPDGTVAWLSPCSSLSYAASFNDKNRDVRLEGATFFEVSKNAGKPFRISAGDYRITVLGTRFNVMAYPESDRFEIDLVEGSVQIDNTTNPSDCLRLRPHERAILCNNRLTKLPSDFDNEEYLKNGIVSFRSRPFGEILEDISLWQGVRLTIHEDVDVVRSVTGKFRQSDSLESILRALQSVADFRYEIIDETHVIIYR